MSPEQISGSYTVQLYSKSGLTKVIGVKDEGIRKNHSYLTFLKRRGKNENDWYRFISDDDLSEVINYAFDLDDKAFQP